MAITGYCHGKPAEQLAEELQTHLEQGLTQQEARERLLKNGYNELAQRQRNERSHDENDDQVVVELVEEQREESRPGTFAEFVWPV